MSHHAPRKVSLPPEFEDFVSSRIASGRYASESEVVREGLRLLEEQELNRDAVRDSARVRIAAGLEQAKRGELLEGEEVFDSLEERIGPEAKRPE